LYRPTPFELARLKQLEVSRMYVRFFDVDATPAGRPEPVAPLRMMAPDSGFAFVPVVFITQRALLALDTASVEQLAADICALAEAMCGEWKMHPAELQIDCDWTRSSRERYFRLLAAIRRQPFASGKLLSCTIRLNQVKYSATTGIPPVDRGMVMCYGMGSLKRYGPYNSILDGPEAEDYLSNIGSYPLPVDVALPAFEWCVLFHNRQYAGILRDITPDMVRQSGLFSRQDKVSFICARDTAWHGYHLSAGDVVRTEAPSPEDVELVADRTARAIKNTELNVVLFSCDSLTLSKYSTDGLQKIYNHYR
jgi:hypothetical protein